MQDFPTFRLFEDPIREKAFTKSDEPCDVCKTPRGWKYATVAFNDQTDEESECICPWCIADGSAAEAGFSFVDPTIYPCTKGSPQLPPEDAKELLERTPEYTTWQGVNWQMCCGRACRYLGEAKRNDLTGRWSSAIESVWRNDDRLKTADDEELATVRQELTSNISDDLNKDVSYCAYVFQCFHCAKLHGHHDFP